MDQIEVLEKKEAEQNEKEEAEAIDEDFDPPENEKERVRGAQRQFHYDR